MSFFFFNLTDKEGKNISDTDAYPESESVLLKTNCAMFINSEQGDFLK